MDKIIHLTINLLDTSVTVVTTENNMDLEYLLPLFIAKGCPYPSLIQQMIDALITHRVK